jgi:hypothetical protein
MIPLTTAAPAADGLDSAIAQQAEAAITPDGRGLLGSRLPKLDQGPPRVRREGDLP